MADEREKETETGSRAPAAGTGGDPGAPGGMGGARSAPGDSGGRPDGGVSPIPADEDEETER